MSKTYVIQWKSKINGRAGKGTKRFTLEEAETLVEELNHEYPNIHHELVDSEVGSSANLEVSGERIERPPTHPVESQKDEAPYEAHAFTE